MINLENKFENLDMKKNCNYKTIFKKVINFGGKYIDYKMGSLGAGIMGSIVFGINYFGTKDLMGFFKCYA